MIIGVGDRVLVTGSTGFLASEGRLPPLFNRGRWHAYWRGSRYTNAKAKRLLGWTPAVPTAEGLRRYFESCRLQ